MLATPRLCPEDQPRFVLRRQHVAGRLTSLGTEEFERGQQPFLHPGDVCAERDDRQAERKVREQGQQEDEAVERVGEVDDEEDGDQQRRLDGRGGDNDLRYATVGAVEPGERGLVG